jgi:hypothetical protein
MTKKSGIKREKLNVRGFQSVSCAHFSSLYVFNKYIEETMGGLRMPGNKRFWESYVKGQVKDHLKSDWYGEPRAASIQELENHDKFLNWDYYHQIKRVVDKKYKRLKAIKTSKIIKTKKRQFNALELGVFSFERAASGLYKLEDDDSEVKYRTTTQDSFIFEDLKGKATKYLRVFIKMGASNIIKGNDLLNVGVGAAILVEKLVKMGIKVEVNIVTAGYHENKEAYVYSVKVKDFESRLKLNDLLIMTASARYFRYKGFKATVTQYDYEGRLVPSYFRYTMDQYEAQWVLDELHKNDKTDFVLFGHSFSQTALLKEIDTVIEKMKKVK